MDSRLKNFLDPLTPDQEPFCNEFMIRQLTGWPGQDSWTWRPYVQKMCSSQAR